MTRTPLLTLILALFACGGRHQTTPSPAPSAAARPQHAAERPEELVRLIDATQLLTVRPVTQDAVVEALRALAAVILAEDAQAAAEIDHAAETLAAGDAASPMALVEGALRRARNVLGDRIPTAPRPAVRDAYVRAALAIDALESGEPLSLQGEHVQTAFAALTNVIAALDGARSVPELAHSIEVGYIADAFRERVDRASELVGTLATARDSEASSDAAHRALRALAEVVEVAPLAAERSEWRSLVLALRFSALRIRGLDPISQERSDHVRAGLLASVAAIERMTQDARLVASARKAAEAIAPHTLFVFQRAAIQDAFRTHVQAFDLVARQMSGERRSAVR